MLIELLQQTCNTYVHLPSKPQPAAAAIQSFVALCRSWIRYPAANLQDPLLRSQQKWTRCTKHTISAKLLPRHCGVQGFLSVIYVRVGLRHVWQYGCKQHAVLFVQLLDWDGFDVFKVAQLSRQRPLQTVTWALMHHFDVVSHFSLPADKLRSFLRVRCHETHKILKACNACLLAATPTCWKRPLAPLGKVYYGKWMLQVLEAGYNRNPYHNATHAADVTQNVGVMLAADDLPCRLSELEVLAMLLAAAVHDVKHPGQSALHRDVPHLASGRPRGPH